MKRIFVFVFLLTAGISLSGCLSKEERANLKEKKQLAEDYFEDKYQENVRIKKSEYLYNEDSFFAVRSDDMYFVLGDGTRIYYDAQSNLFFDNYQADEIIEDFEDEIWNPMMEEMGDYRYGNGKQDTQLYVNYYDLGTEYDNFFHEYYDGNIKSYTQEEDLRITVGHIEEGSYLKPDYIYLLCENNRTWEDKFNIIEDTIDKYSLSSVYVAALTEELYETEVVGYNMYVDTSWEGCWATLNYDGVVEQKYIKIADGIYASIAEPGKVFRNGDIKLVEGEPVDIKSNYNVCTPVYQIEISDRVWEYADDSLEFYIRVRPEEIGLTEEYSLYFFNPGSEYYNEVSGEQKYGQSFYIFKKEDANPTRFFIGNE